jgi:hypothetical protein
MQVSNHFPPKSVSISFTDLIETKIESQIKMTGNAAMEVLSMSVRHNDGDALPSYQEIVKNDEIQDAAHSAYSSAIMNVKEVRDLFALLVYDPMFRRLTKDEQKNFISVNRIKLGRLRRTQMNILQIDNLIRSGMLKDDTLNSDLLQRVGEHVATLLDRSNSQTLMDERARRLLKEDLPAIRREVDHHLQRRSGHTSIAIKIDDPTISDEELSRLLSKFDDESYCVEFIDAFFGMETDMLYRQVETLIVRCLRLHHIWPLQKL